MITVSYKPNRNFFLVIFRIKSRDIRLTENASEDVGDLVLKDRSHPLGDR